jgi:hypothetical protein
MLVGCKSVSYTYAAPQQRLGEQGVYASVLQKGQAATL